MPDVVGTGVIRLEVDKAGAQADIDAFVAQTDAKLKAAGTQGGKSFGDGFTKGSDKVDTSLKKVGTDLDTVKKKAESAGGKNKSEGLGLLLTTALAIGPALVPLGAVAAAGLGAIVVGAGTAALAVKGITDEIKAGTSEGKQYQQGLTSLKTELTGLSQIAAHGFLAPFQTTVSDLTKQFPQLNSLVSKFSGIVGTDVSLALHGIIGGFIQLEPLFIKMGQDSEHLFQDFDKFANGGGLKKFSDYAIQELPQVEDTLTALGGAVVHLVQGLAPLGSLSLTGLQILSDLIKDLSPEEINAIATGITAWAIANKALALSNGLGNLLSKSSIGAVNELGSGLAGIGSKAVGVAGVAIALDQIYANATHTQPAINVLLDSLAKFASGQGKAGLTALGNLNYQNKLPGSSSSDTKLTHPLGSTDQLNQQTYQAAYGLNNLAAAQLAVNTQFAKATSGTASVSAYSSQLENETNVAQSALDHTKALTDATDDNSVVLGSIQISQKAWAQALKESNGDQQAALVLVEQAKAQGPAYQKVIDDTAAKQQKLNDAISQAALASGLTSDQVKTYAGILGITGDELASGALSASAFATQMQIVKNTLDNGNPAIQALLGQMQKFSTSGGNAADRAALLGQTLVSIQGDALSYAGAQADAYTANRTLTQSFADQVEQIKAGTLAYSDSEKAAINYSKAADGSTQASIDFTKAGAGPLINQLSAMQDAAEKAAEATYQHEVATKGSSQAASDAATIFKTQTYDALVKDAKQLGITTDQAKALADGYFNISDKDLKSTVEAVGLTDINGTLDRIGQLLANLTGQPWNIQVGIHVNDATALQNLIAKTSDPRFNNANGSVMEYYANGGMRENHIAQIAPANSIRTWAEPETGGESYIPLAPAKRARSTAIWRETGRRLGQSFAEGGFADGGFSGNSGAGMAELIAAINALASRDVVLEANGTQLARVVNNQQLVLARGR